MKNLIITKNLENFNHELRGAITHRSVDYQNLFDKYFELDVDLIFSIDEETIISMFTWFYYEGIEGWFSVETIEEMLWCVLVYKLENMKNVKVHWEGEEIVLDYKNYKISLEVFRSLEPLNRAEEFSSIKEDLDEEFGDKVEDFFDCVRKGRTLEKFFKLLPPK